MGRGGAAAGGCVPAGGVVGIGSVLVGRVRTVGDAVPLEVMLIQNVVERVHESRLLGFFHEPRRRRQRVEKTLLAPAFVPNRAPITPVYGAF